MMGLKKIPARAGLSFWPAPRTTKTGTTKTVTSHPILILLSAIVCLVTTLGDRADAGTPLWKRGSHQATYALDRPWETKGLTPVTLTDKPELPAVVIANKGRAVLPIVIPAGDPYYAEVAATLKLFLDEAIGGSFTVITDKDAPRQGIFVGPCRNPDVERVTRRVAELPPEHFVVDCLKGGVILAGQDLDFLYEKPRGRLSRSDIKQSRGTYFAVLDFLERFIGVRFFKPGRLGTVVPYRNDHKVIFPPVTYQDGPVFKSRASSYGNYLTQDHKLLGSTKKSGLQWMDRLRRGDVYQLKCGHTDTYWHEVYAETHPEFFALREDGTRMIGEGASVHSSQRCYSNEAGFQEHLRLIDRYYETGEGERLLRSPPNSKYIYWWPNDGFKGCACSECMKRTDSHAPADRVHSRLIWPYVAKLARAIKQRWPDKVLVAPLYATWFNVPKDFTMPENVRLIVTWNHVSEGLFKEPKYWNFAVEGLKQQGRQSCEPVVIWSHYPHKPRIKNGFDAPYPLPHVLKRLLLSQRNQLGGVYLNGYACTSFALDGYILYVYKKMLWNPNLDVDAALDNYCRALFGPAAPQVNAYLSTVIERWETTRWSTLPEGFDFVDGRIGWQSYYKESYPRDVRLTLKGLLARGVAKTSPGSVYHARAKYFAEATEPFFIQGEFFDRGNMVTVEAQEFVPKIDGNLKEWEGKLPLRLKNNSDGGKATVRTDILIAFGPKAFYIAGRAEEPETIRAFPKELPRDSSLSQRDSIELFLCTPQPGIQEAGLSITDQYHQIILDPNGALFDGYKRSDTSEVDPRATLELTHKVKRYPHGFTFEMAIPYTTLKTSPPRPGDHWMANFFRNRPRDGALNREIDFAWSPTFESHHMTSRYGRIEFPTETYWTADLTNFAPSWSIKQIVSGSIRAFEPDQHIKITSSRKHGHLFLHIQADEELPRGTELKFVSSKAKATFPKPVTLDWKFQYHGKGLNRVRHYAVGTQPKSQLSSALPTAKDGARSGWVFQEAVKPTQGDLRNLSYYAFGLAIEPGADFVFEIDQIRLKERR